MYRCAVAAVVAASLAGAAAAQVARQFPQNALRGELVITAPPEAALNGAPMRLAPGARIRNADNLLALPATIVGQRLFVHYTVDGGGQLRDVWILRPDELAKVPWPTTPQQAASWAFDPIAQVWTRP
jgi:hypothetical protein